jgi:peptidoglycan/LPS O-acetylase OafA/YrhL
MTLDLVMWSLVHELRISFLFPLLFVLTRRWPAATMAASLGMGAACTAALAGAEATNLATSLVDTGRFVFLFVFGIVIAGRVDGIRRVVARLPRGIAGLLWIASIVLILAPGPSVSDYYNFVWGAGAIILIFLTVGSVRADRLLCMPPLLWLGRISYSLYLIHVPLLIASVHITDGILPTWITVLGVIPLSLACGGLMHRLVEEPSIRLGRHLTRKHRRLSDLPLAPTLSATRRLP